MKSSSSLFLICTAFFIFPFLLMAENNDYNRYRRQLKEKLGIELSVPDSSFEFVSGPFGDFETVPSDIVDYSKGHILSFGDNHPLLGCAAYLFGPTVKLNEHCRVAMMDIENVSKPRPLHRPAPCDYTFAQTSSWMLNNCGEPWAFFYIYDIRGVRDENAVRPSPEELRAMQEKADSLRTKYERCVEDGDIVEKTNCDRVFIVRIPDIEKIGTNPDFAPFLATEYVEALKSNATQCYGVEFYRKANYDPLKMLFFINADEISIDECVSDMAEYIEFENIDFE